MRERRGVRRRPPTRSSHLIFNAVYDFQGLLPVHVYNVLMIVLPLLIPRLHRFGENVGAMTLALLILVAHMFVVWAMGITSDLHVYYTLAGPSCCCSACSTGASSLSSSSSTWPRCCLR